MNHARSIHSGLRFPFERMHRFGWQVAALGGWWRVGIRMRYPIRG